LWRVGRLTLEPWLTPRLDPEVVRSRPGTQVTAVDATSPDVVRLALSDGDLLEVDHVIAASGYRADLAAVPYLAGVLERVSVTDGFPDLSPGFETTLPGLFVTGFAATRDFGPFYGFTKGCPSSARIAVAEMRG
jgi:thioredoxin reductase